MRVPTRKLEATGLFHKDLSLLLLKDEGISRRARGFGSGGRRRVGKSLHSGCSSRGRGSGRGWGWGSSLGIDCARTTAGTRLLSSCSRWCGGGRRGWRGVHVIINLIFPVYVCYAFMAVALSRAAAAAAPAAPAALLRGSSSGLAKQAFAEGWAKHVNMAYSMHDKGN